MNRKIWPGLALLALALGACNELTPVDNTPAPTPTTMQFKSGARYEYSSYHTDAATGQKTDTSARTRTWTLVNPSASAYGETGVAVYVDSVFSVGGIFNVADTTYLQQRSNNDVYRYGLLVPELDINVGGVASLNIPKLWMHEAQLSASSANWFVGQTAQTMAFSDIPGVTGIKVAVTDSVVGSSVVDYPVNGTNYSTTKTTHNIILGFYAETFLGEIALSTATLQRTTWMAPSLGAIVHEEREGKVINLSFQGQGTSVPVPGYVSTMTRVIATGS
jgi:hypothetical protein